MDTPIYDELVSQVSGQIPADPAPGTCQWCGTPVEGAAVQHPATDPAGGDDITLVACSAEHMAALEEHRKAD